MQTIVVQTIPHSEQRYDTVGDYFTIQEDDQHAVRHFRISDMQNNDYEFLVMIHELIENHFVQKAGISDASIDEFDIRFEQDRAKGKIFPPDMEPGNCIDAPYHLQHLLATRIERWLADALEINWDAYDQAVNSL